MASPLGSNGILAGARILIVEDEVLIAFDLRDGFQEAGARSVSLAHTLAEATALASRAPLTAAVLDVRLGSEGAAPVAQILTDRGIPFLFYTGQPPTDPIFRAFPCAAAMVKPTDVRTLAYALSRLHRDEPLDGIGRLYRL